MKSIIYITAVTLILGGCQFHGRGMAPPHSKNITLRTDMSTERSAASIDHNTDMIPKLVLKANTLYQKVLKEKTKKKIEFENKKEKQIQYKDKNNTHDKKIKDTIKHEDNNISRHHHSKSVDFASKPKSQSFKKTFTELFSNVEKIPIVKDFRKVLPQGSKTSKYRIKKKHLAKYPKSPISQTKKESFSGGTVQDGLDMGLVRLGQSRTYTRVIFDTFKWEEGKIPTQKSPHSGSYVFTYEPNKRQIVAIIDGYRAFSGLAGDQSALYEGNPIVQNIRIDERIDESGFKFIIELKQDVQVYIYELHNPGRIIIDLFLPTL